MKTYYMNVSSLSHKAFELLEDLIENKLFSKCHTEMIAKSNVKDSLLYVLHDDTSIDSYERWDEWSINLRKAYYSETVTFPVVVMQDKDVHQIQLNLSLGFPPFYLTCLED